MNIAEDKHFIQMQESVMDYFKDTPDLLFSQIVDSFVYLNPAANDKVSETITKFIKDNGVEMAYVNYVSELRNPPKYFRRIADSEVQIIEQLRKSFLNAAFNRYKNIHIEKKKAKDTNKKNLNFLKKELLEIYDRLNSDEHYFYGEKEDAKLVAKIQKIKYED